MDYQPHNFTCYTVPECNSDDESSSTPTISSNSDNDFMYNRRLSAPPPQFRQLSPADGELGTLGRYHYADNSESSEIGYFVPLSARFCYLSPPIQRKYFRYIF